jgi:hypothetical protein
VTRGTRSDVVTTAVATTSRIPVSESTTTSEDDHDSQLMSER